MASGPVCGASSSLKAGQEGGKPSTRARPHAASGTQRQAPVRVATRTLLGCQTSVVQLMGRDGANAGPTVLKRHRRLTVQTQLA